MEHISTLPTPCLDVRDLRVVLAVASAGSTARAATLLHLTQPAVSRALLGAEERIGTRLFERTTRGLVATLAGERLLEGARQVLAQLLDLEHRLRAPVTKPTRLRIVCECYTAYHWLPSTLVRLREGLPGLDLVLRVEFTDDPLAALEAGHIDAALVTSPLGPKSALVDVPLFTDEVVFLVAKDHPLAAKKVLAPRDLRSFPLLTSKVPAAEGSWFMSAVFGRARPRLTLSRLPLTEAIIDVARAGMGIAVLSEWVASAHLAKGDLVSKRLAKGPLQRPWRLAFRPEGRAGAERLRAALCSAVPRARAFGAP